MTDGVNQSLTRWERQHILDTAARIAVSATKHGCDEMDILHAVRQRIRTVEQDYHGSIQVLVIGPAIDGTLLEVVVVTDQELRIVHADKLRPKFYRYLKG